ncbi:MAG: rRNA processing protein RimM [Fimbriimonadaceae bacterium]|jgi:16S rRNA processing protein RimM|nr:rRNA processing protein RimM [Fimbriimonadaceae bacterium]
MSEFIRIGQIVGAFGLKGEVKVDTLTDFDQRFQKGSRVRLKGDWATIESVRIHKGRPLVKFAGVDDASAAESLRWQYLEAPALAPEALEDDEYLVDDLVGMKVVTVEGEELGLVDKVLSYPAHDILQVGDLLIPLVKEFVKEVDLEGEIIRVQLIPGMRGEA